MLIEFSVQNFRSIKNLQTLKMSAANIVSKYKDVDSQNVIKVSEKLSLLKSKAIYGANASGKSNIIRALVSFISVVYESVKDEKILSKRVEPFLLSTVTEKQPTFFQLTFILNNVFYRYGFEATATEIVSEWLFGTPGRKEVAYYTRENQNIEVNEKHFKEGAKLVKLFSKDGNDIARTNSLFLTAVKAFNGELAKSIVDYIADIIVLSGLSDQFMRAFANEALGEDTQKQKIVDFLKIADIGIENVRRVEIDNKEEAQTTEESETNKKKFITITEHKKFNGRNKIAKPQIFSMTLHESEGSKKMFEISPFVLEALEEKRVLVIDEFDARFHPLLTKKLVELFNSTTNDKTQFIFATHDVNLLNASLLRRDQISFVEKDKYGSSHLYDLVSFKGIRNDSSFEKDYIHGKYGAIPFLGDFSSLIED